MGKMWGRKKVNPFIMNKLTLPFVSPAGRSSNFLEDFRDTIQSL